MQKPTFAFDLGKASMGICARTDSEILELKSLNIPAEFAMTSDFRSRRRAERTRQAHKKREEWLCQKWQEAGLIPLTSDDPEHRLKREFPKKGDDTIYNSALLRVALIQEKQLQEWQIFKALWSAIQLRGYDDNLPWASNYSPEEIDDTQAKDEKENRESAARFAERLHEAITPHFQYEYPCFLQAHLMGLWRSEAPETFQLRIDHNAQKIRRKPGSSSAIDPGNVAPRALVEKELRKLLENAQKQLPKLQNIDIDEWLYGPSKQAYASYKNKNYKKYRGTKWDTQGLLSQKVPRFDNRIIGKCRLFPTRNTCKANDDLNIRFTVLMKLKNLRFTDENGEHNRGLRTDEFKKAYERLMENLAGKKSREFGAPTVRKELEKAIGMKIHHINLADKEKVRINTSGRSRFCRPALRLMIDILLSGKNPPEFDITPYIQSPDVPNHISNAELEKAVSRLGKTWEQFSVQDDRYSDVLTQAPAVREQAIFETIGSINNPIVRHRLMVFYNELKRMSLQYGEPERIILEFIRGDEGLNGNKTAKDWERMIKENEKANDHLRKDLEDLGRPITRENLLRLRLLREQGGKCAYTGNPIVETQIHQCQIDHIVPISQEMSTDALYNKVLAITSANQDKGNRTPFEWLSVDPHRWAEYSAHVQGMKGISKKKRELLLAKDSRELVESYNGLAETAYMGRLAQQIVSLHYGWGLQTEGDKRRVFVNSGRETAKIRSIYKLNELLLSDEERANLKLEEKIKKNRKNPKHHALDAYCISYSQNLRPKQRDNGDWYWEAIGLTDTKAQFERLLLELFPNNPLRNKKELYPQETIYGYKTKTGIEKKGKKEVEVTKHYLTVHKGLVDLLGKDRKNIKNIWDEDIKADLDRLSDEITDKDEWIKTLQNYKHPKRKSSVKRVMVIETEQTDALKTDASGRRMLGEFKDFGNGATQGQFKHSKQHKGQIIYFDSKDKPKVQPVYAHQSLKAVQAELKANNFKLYNNGMLFYSGAEVTFDKHFQGSPIQYIDKKKKRGEAQDFEAGKYKLNTIQAKNGDVELTSANGQLIGTNIKYLVEAGFSIYSYNVRTETNVGVQS